jgi:sulfite reductase subunit B
MKNPYHPIKAIIEHITEETPTIKTFHLRPEKPIEFKTGQFVELTVPGRGEAPFTPSSDPFIKDRMELTIMNVGKVTSILHGMDSGDVLGIRGPYGKGYPIEEFYGKEIVIVGGGVGLAPLRSLLLTLFNSIDKYKKISLYYGARRPEDIVYKKLLPTWRKKKNFDLTMTVDVGGNGWKGNIGLVTTILKDFNVNKKEAKVVVCGPPIMMKFTTFKLLDEGFQPENLFLSMEKNMSCGLGKCGHCRLGKYYVCKDGPVFSFDELQDIPDIWD